MRRATLTAWMCLAVAAALPASAEAARDRVAPRWTDPPRELSSRHLEDCSAGNSVITFAVPVEDTSPLRISIEVRDVRTGALVATALRVPRTRWLTARWPASIVQPGEIYQATFCAHDAAGNSACAEEVATFAGPWPRVVRPEVVAKPIAREPLPREQRLAQTPRPGQHVDRRYVGGGALGLALLALLFALRAVERRAARLV